MKTSKFTLLDYFVGIFRSVYTCARILYVREVEGEGPVSVVELSGYCYVALHLEKIQSCVNVRWFESKLVGEPFVWGEAALVED